MLGVWDLVLRFAKLFCNPGSVDAVLSLGGRTKAHRKPTIPMKKTLIAMLGAAVIASTGLALAQGHGGHGGRGWHHGDPLDNLTESLSLTPDQQAKVQPILDQAKPQLMAIHKEAMEKSKAVIDNAMSQIRPMLTPDQQKKADDMKAAHEDMRNAMKRMHDLKGQ